MSAQTIYKRLPRNVRTVALRGSGGGGGKSGGGSARTAKEDADTLISRSLAKVIDVLGEGPFEGFDDPDHPLRCVFLDGTPIENADGRAGSDATYVQGSPNVTFSAARANQSDVGKGFTGAHTPQYTTIKSVADDGASLVMSENADGSGTGLWGIGGSLNWTDFAYYFLPGSATQGYMPGFDSEENITAVGVRVKELLHWEQAFTDNTIDAVRIDVRFPRLQQQDVTNGDIHGASVRLQVQIDSNGGGFVTVIDDTVRGKASGAYIRTYRVELAGKEAPWTVRVNRITPDSTSQALQNETWIDSYTEVTYAKLSHINTAAIGIQFDAAQFGSIPRRGYLMRAVKIKVPVNYDPINRTYAGTWDGTFKLAWTNNPAWCWYAMATNVRWGLGHLVKPEEVNKWALYVIGQYCDVMVPTGYGGTEPRFTCNLYLQKANDAYKVLSDMMGICRGLVAYQNGILNPVQDSPVDPSAYRMFSPVNVLNGTFSYSGVGLKARHNAVRVSWQDYSDQGNTKYEYAEDSEAIASLGGINMLDIAGFGCWSRGQARRWALGALYMEKLLTDTVTFQTALEGYFIAPGQIIQVQDPFRAGQSLSGRLLAATSTNLSLDRPVTLLAGHTYTIGVIKPSDGTIVSATVLNGAGITSNITVAALAEIPEDESVFQIAANDLKPELFRVLAFSSKDDNTGEVTGLQYNESLYDFIDFNEPLDVPPTSTLPNDGGVLPPGPIEVEEVLTIDRVHGAVRSLEVAWGQSPDPFLESYRFSYRRNAGNWVNLPDTLTAAARIADAPVGTYDLNVTAVNTIGLRSSPLVTASYVVEEGNPLGPPSITGLELWGQPNSVAFAQRDAKFVWRLNSPAWFVDIGTGHASGGQQDPLFQAFDVSIFSGNQLIWHELTDATEYTFTLEKNREAMRLRFGEGTPAENHFRIEVRILDSFSNLSEPARLTVINPPPAAPVSASLHGTLTGVAVQWVNGLENDLDHVAVFMSADQQDSAPALVGTESFPGTSHSYHGLNQQGDTSKRYFWVSEVDTFGNVSPLAFVGGTVPGYAVEPVTFSPNGGYVGAPTRVTLACRTQQVNIYWTTAANGNSGWQLYDPANKPLISSGVTLYAYASLVNNAQIVSAIESVQFEAGVGVVTPSFTPDDGNYPTQSGTLDVIIETQTGGATLMYTVDGSTPTATHGFPIPTNSGIVNLPTGTTTLKARGFLGGYLDSYVGEATYQVSQSSGGQGVDTVATPTFTPPAGEYNSSDYPKTITIATATSQAQIRYTTDGTAPSPTVGTLISASSGVAVVNAGETLRAMAFKAGYNPSATAAAHYTTSAACATPAFDPVSGPYPAFPKTITISTDTTGAHMRYTTDGSDPTETNGTLIPGTSGAASVAAGQTLKAVAFRSDLMPSAVASGLYQQQATVATPTYSPAAGAYNSADYPKPIMVSCATAGADIRCTTDGTTPTSTHGTLIASGDSVLVNAGETLRAMAYKAGLIDSNVASGTYTAASNTVATPTFNPDGGYLVGTGYSYTFLVLVATGTSGAQISYTLDGSTPTPSHGTVIPASSGTVSVHCVSNQTKTLRAMAFKAGLNDSGIHGNDYTFEHSGG